MSTARCPQDSAGLRQPARLWATWLVATASGHAGGGLLGTVIASAIDGWRFDWGFDPGMMLVSQSSGVLIVAPIHGACMGLAQWLVLRRVLPGAWRLVPISAIALCGGRAVGTVASESLSAAARCLDGAGSVVTALESLRLAVPLREAGGIAGVPALVLTKIAYSTPSEMMADSLCTYGSLGMGQWLVLHGRVRHAWAWFPACLLAGALAVGVEVALRAPDDPHVGSGLAGGLLNYAWLGAITGALIAIWFGRDQQSAASEEAPP